MMERMKEMKQWWHEVVLEVEDAGSHHNNTNVCLFLFSFCSFFLLFLLGVWLLRK